MAFLNAMLLAGVLGFNIPIIIHLLNRSRFKVVKWGAMHLLEPVVRKNMRRLRLEQLLLLLIRALIPALLAMCMAAPVLTGCQHLAGNVPASLVVLLDASYSMQAAEQTQNSYEIAQQNLGAILQDMPRGSDATILLLGGPATPLNARPALDLDRLRTSLVNTRAVAGPVRTLDSLKQAIAQAQQMRNAQRDILLVSDFQAVNWANIDDAELTLLRESMANADIPISLTLMPVGRPMTGNIAVEEMQVSPQVMGVGQTLRINATVRHYGQAEGASTTAADQRADADNTMGAASAGDASASRASLRVLFRVDGQERDERRIDLAPGQRTQVLFQHTFDADQPGSHWLEVVADRDPVRADNALLHALTVLDRLPVLIVTGQRGERFGEGETDYLEIALQPAAAADEKVDLRDLLSTTVIDPDALRTFDLSTQRVIVLADVPTLDDEALARLETFVAQGGGLLIFPGQEVAARGMPWYDQAMYRAAAGLAPMRLAGVGAVAGREADMPLAQQRYDHPALTMFNLPRNGNLAAIGLRRWFQLRRAVDAAPGSRDRPAGAIGDQVDADATPVPVDIDAAEASAAGVRVIAELDDGSPFLVEGSYGRGRVLLAAGPCSTDWSNMPALGNIYLPLMQRLVAYLGAQGDPPRNLTVGQPLAALLDAEHVGKSLTLEHHPLATSGQQTVGVNAIDRRVQVVAAGQRAQAAAPAVNLPGRYTMRGYDVEPIHFVVNVDRRESDLRRLDDAQLAAIAEKLGARVAENSQAYLTLETERRFGREIWRWLFWPIILLLALEMFVQQRSWRRRPS